MSFGLRDKVNSFINCGKNWPGHGSREFSFSPPPTVSHGTAETSLYARVNVIRTAAGFDQALPGLTTWKVFRESVISLEKKFNNAKGIFVQHFCLNLKTSVENTLLYLFA